MRDLGRRMALNAPIQGSASDVFKVAMVAVDGALRDADLGWGPNWSEAAPAGH